MRAERDDACARERGDIHDRGGLEAPRVMKRIAQHEAAFRVRVQDLDGVAGGARDDVARLHGAAARHVLAGGDEPDHVQRQAQLGTSVSAAMTAAEPLMSNFISSIGRRVLERDAAGVERDALADEHDGRLRRLRPLVFDDDEPRRLRAALRDGEEAAHLLLADAGFVEHRDLDRGVRLRERLRLVREIGRACRRWRAGCARSRCTLAAAAMAAPCASPRLRRGGARAAHRARRAPSPAPAAWASWPVLRSLTR